MRIKPPFGVALSTRIGQNIGKGRERVMLNSVGGGAGIRKTYRDNPDGSRTMLATRGGMPEFSTPEVKESDPLVITVGNAFGFTPGGDLTVYLTHSIALSKSFPSPRSYPFSIVALPPTGGNTYAIHAVSSSDFSDGVIKNMTSISVPSGVTSFTVTVTVDTHIPGFFSSEQMYEIHVQSAVGVGTLYGI